MGIKTKNKDPKTYDFAGDDIIINHKEGTLFFKSDNGLHKITPGSGVSDKVWTLSGDNIFYLDGKVGIGTDAPTTELDVNGTVKATSFSGDGASITGVISASYAVSS